MPKRKQKEDVKEKEVHKDAEEDNYEEDDFHELYKNEEELEEEDDCSLGEGEDTYRDYQEEF